MNQSISAFFWSKFGNK